MWLVITVALASFTFGYIANYLNYGKRLLFKLVVMAMHRLYPQNSSMKLSPVNSQLVVPVGTAGTADIGQFEGTNFKVPIRLDRAVKTLTIPSHTIEGRYIVTARCIDRCPSAAEPKFSAIADANIVLGVKNKLRITHVVGLPYCAAALGSDATVVIELRPTPDDGSAPITLMFTGTQPIDLTLPAAPADTAAESGVCD